jgi:anti-sigma regulatory factor (Ser/Thr protein kinase)
MSFSRSKRESIKAYILEKIASNDHNISQKTTDTFQITETTYYRYLHDLEKQGIIFKSDGSRKYRLTTKTFSKIYDLQSEGLRYDDKIYLEDIFPIIDDLPQNVIHMWDYCFTEMMNNVIDHSNAEHVAVSVFRDYIQTTIIISDDGIGIFNKIQKYFGYSSLNDVIMELFKGKLTTDHNNHSGEGIFFTSKIADLFAAISDGKVFSHSNYTEVLKDVDELPAANNNILPVGTTILMRITNHSQKDPAEIFNTYSDVDGGFYKTSIPLKNIYDRYPVSRSQAKRLVHRFEDFKEIDLDFEGISDIGQGFAHQLFHIYHRDHPEITLNAVNTNEKISRMIYHVTH